MTEIKDDDYWQQRLSPAEFRVCRQKGTERAFSGEYWDEKAAGIYHCRCCGRALFSSAAKYDSGSGWPSFWEPLSDEAIAEFRDTSHGMVRVEVCCKDCGCHLGHVFHDGPQPSGLRYCVNSLSIKLEKSE